MLASRIPQLGWKPSSTFVFRTPLLPLKVFIDWGEDIIHGNTEDFALARRRLIEHVERPEVQEALFVASPDLFASLPSWLSEPNGRRGHRTERTIVRYFSRMVGRSTPFGLFSGVSLGHLADQTLLETVGTADCTRRTRLDNDFLFGLMDQLGRDAAIRRVIQWRPNSSIYCKAKRLRYVKTTTSGRSRSYSLVAVEHTDYIALVLERAHQGANFASLAQALLSADSNITLEEAEDFLEELINEQLLVSALDPPVTGDEPTTHLLAVLKTAAPGLGVIATLEAASERLRALDARGIGNNVRLYFDVFRDLKALSIQPKLPRLFQVDLFKPAPRATLDHSIVSEIERGINLLLFLTPNRGEHDLLSDFRRRFSARYGDSEVPILEALDEDAGVGFDPNDDPGVEGAPLLAGLTFPPPEPSSTISWDDREKFLVQKLHDIWSAGKTELLLTTEDFHHLRVDTPQPVPDALSVLALLAASSEEAINRGDYTFMLRSAAGPSGARLLGRFCRLSRDIHGMVTDHLASEEALRPDAVFAEIVHLNEPRTGNIASRPVLREYEIPYLGLSGALQDRQIPLNDLLVRVQGGRIQLRSQALDREVVPRMSTAHNYSPLHLGVYRFLCTLQEQDGGHFYWQWGPLLFSPFLPRVRCGRIVLARARWLLRHQELTALRQAVRSCRKTTTAQELSKQRERLFLCVQELRAKRRLPRYVVVADRDNELPVDLGNPLSVDSFAWLVHQRKDVVLLELFPPPGQMIAKSPDGLFCHELILSFTRDREATRPSQAPRARPTNCLHPPRYPPGSSWLYAKLYMTPSTSDSVLQEVVGPVCREALECSAATQWFFLRYRDPDYHLRVRLSGEPERLSNKVLPMLQHAAAPMLADGRVWRIVLDTYEPEVERYGGSKGIALSEQLFWCDSQATLEIIESLRAEPHSDVRWQLALRGAEFLLQDLGFDSDSRAELVRDARNALSKEFRAGHELRKQLGVLCRSKRPQVDEILGLKSVRNLDSALQAGIAALERRSERIRPIAHELKTRTIYFPRGFSEFAWSHVHMHINRLLCDSQRAQELVIYNLLDRWHAERRARQNMESGVGSRQ